MLHKNTLLCAGLGAVFLFAQVPLASAAVVTSMKPLGFIAAAIADGVTETQVLLPDGASEHDYSLRPSDVKRLQNADLVVWIGPEMEAFMDKSTQSIAANKKVTIAELDGVKPLLITGADDDDDHHGHDHGAGEIARAVTQAFNNLPRPHRVMLGSLSVLTLAVAVWRPYIYHPESAPIVRTIELEKSEIRSLLPEASEPIDQAPQEEEAIPQDELDEKADSDAGGHEYVVSTGDTLSSILNQYGIDMGDIAQLSSADKELRNLKIGQQLSWTLTADGDLQSLTWEMSRRETRTYTRVDNGFKMSSELQKGDWVNSVLKGTVGASFVSSARDAGLTSTEINAVIKAMQWQMDFRKLKKGDEFSVLMSREMLDGKREQSQLLGVRLRSDGKDYYAIRAEDGKFYDRNGTGLAKGFMRFPTARQFRVSSNFNPRRLNPVTGRVAPHRGVDFAMPQGTPVLAVGDGEVVVAKRSGAAGYYVAIRHGRTYTTRYMHLRKLLVKPGQKVKRGDRIALSGNTGRSTGPHLHYEVWINQQAVNPLTAKLPRTEGLSGSDRTDYLAQVKEVVPQLRFD